MMMMKFLRAISIKKLIIDREWKRLGAVLRQKVDLFVQCLIG